MTGKLSVFELYSSMKTYGQWLIEREARTRLGIYPQAYGGNAGRPPLYGAPTSAGNLNAYAGVRGGDNPELLSPPVRKQWKKNMKNMFPKDNPWAKSFSYVK